MSHQKDGDGVDDDGDHPAEREGWLGLGEVYIIDGLYGGGGEKLVMDWEGIYSGLVIGSRRYREEKVGWGEEKEEQSDSFDGTKMYELAFLIISVVFVVWRVIVEICSNKSTCSMWLAGNKSVVNKGRNGRGKSFAFFKGRRLLIALVVFVLSSVSSSEAARDLEVDGVRLKVCCIIHYLYHFDTH